MPSKVAKKAPSLKCENKENVYPSRGLFNKLDNRFSSRNLPTVHSSFAVLFLQWIYLISFNFRNCRAKPFTIEWQVFTRLHPLPSPVTRRKLIVQKLTERKLTLFFRHKQKLLFLFFFWLPQQNTGLAKCGRDEHCAIIRRLLFPPLLKHTKKGKPTETILPLSKGTCC